MANSGGGERQCGRLVCRCLHSRCISFPLLHSNCILSLATMSWILERLLARSRGCHLYAGTHINVLKADTGSSTPMLQPFWCKYDGATVTAGRQTAMPHIKSYTRHSCAFFKETDCKILWKLFMSAWNLHVEPHLKKEVFVC